MSIRGFDRVLAGTAVALVLSLGSALAQSPAPVLDEAAIQAAVPVPEPADVPPPSLADVGGSATAAVPATTEKPAAPQATAPASPAPAATTTPAPAATPEPAKPATAPAAPVKAAETTPSPDAPVMDALKTQITTRLSRLSDRKENRTAVEEFYGKRNYAPLWVTNNAANAQAKAAMGYLASVDSEGLDPSDYPAPSFASGDANALAESELKLTLTLLTYARNAQIGRVHFSRVSGDIQFDLDPPEPADVLAKLAEAKDMAGALASYNPPHAGYKALKAKLAELRGKTEEAGPARIPDGKSLKVGMKDSRVPLVRERLGLAANSDETYDKELADAVKAFQKQKKIKATGTLTDATVDAINGPRRDKSRTIDAIIATMERWRWLPRDLGKAHVMLNIPNFTLKVMKDGHQVWTTRVVVGKPNTPTPELTETMKFITVNPTWNVPPSIVYNEYLPALQQDPTVLERMGLRVSQRPDGSVHISQPPGDRNALGRIRFNFPNKFLVYQHDTPDKHLFAHDKRAYSHGCMRVQDPLKYGEVLLSIAMPNERYTAEKLRGMFGPGEINLNFQTQIPVHITYQTAFVDEAGKLVTRDDIYGRDARLLAALRGDERRVADVAVPRSQPNYSRPPARLPPGYGSYGREPTFFEQLFGAPVPPAPVGQRRAFAR
jgi:murein L,D-transpeptidase YcbB/YkuD